MANYVWTPFNTLNTSAISLPDPSKIQGIKDLGKLKDTDVLYVFAHHGKFLPHIGDSDGNKLNVYELADALIEAGLRKTHECIKLWVCFAGFGMQHKQGFAYDFWYTMHNMYGFHNLTVFAYTEITVDPIIDKHKSCYAINAEQNYVKLEGTAKNYRVGMRANGAFIGLGQS